MDIEFYFCVGLSYLLDTVRVAGVLRDPLSQLLAGMQLTVATHAGPQFTRYFGEERC